MNLKKSLPGISPDFIRIVVGISVCAVIGYLLYGFPPRPDLWGRWVLNFGPSYERAGNWVNENTTRDSILVTNWFFGDFLRSYTGRTTIHSPRLRARTRKSLFWDQLDVSPLSNVAQILHFASRRHQPVYVLRNEFGPNLPFHRTDRITRLKTFRGASDTSYVYKVNGSSFSLREYDQLPLPSPNFRNIALLGQAFGNTGTSRIAHLMKLNDGRLGDNSNWEAATTHPATKKPHGAFFGIWFSKPRTVSSASAFVSFYKNPRAENASPLQFVPVEYRWQYWNKDKWTTIEHETKNDTRILTTRFSPVKTRRLRLVIDRARSRNGTIKGNNYRVSCLELRIFSENETPLN